MRDTTKIIHHYGRKDIRPRLEAALKDAGLGDGTLSPTDLAPLDQFHTRGLVATTELADAAGVESDYAVIDVGSGLGGPSRYLATRFGCLFKVSISARRSSKPQRGSLIVPTFQAS
jgi:hypothetical protein